MIPAVPPRQTSAETFPARSYSPAILLLAARLGLKGFVCREAEFYEAQHCNPADQLS